MKQFINCNGQLVDLSTSKVMGILNVTPDSFYDGGRYNSNELLLHQTEKMLAEGATFIDIGAYSSRPNAKNISQQDELKLSLNAVKLILSHFPETLISVDTFRSEIAQQTIDAGACMINDISGGSLDKNMFKTIAKNKIPYILMHMLGTPQNMQLNPQYKDIIYDLRLFFSKKINKLKALDVNDIILDVGFGFGKTITHNYTLLQHLDLFKSFGLPILVGISRKSMLYKVLETSAKEALNATTVANTIALQKGAKILRVHDVKQAIETIKIVTQLPD